MFRYAVIVLGLFLVVAGILFCLFKISYVDGDRWVRTWQKQQAQMAEKIISPNRGNILSEDGKLMSTSMRVYDLYIDFKLGNSFPEDSFLHSRKDGIDSLAHYLSKKLRDRSVEGYKTHLKNGLKSKSTAFKVTSQRVSYLDLKEIRKYPFFRFGRYASGFYDVEYVERRKLFGPLAGRTIGDIDENYRDYLSKGAKGIELRYDSLLRGEPGRSRNVRIGRGLTSVSFEDPVDGYDVVTTIDTQIQDIVDKALRDKARELRPQEAVAIVMEVKTGEIKAITNLIRMPGGAYYEAENRAVNGLYEPGSTFKTAVMMVALEDGACTPDQLLDTGNGLYRYRNLPIRDHNFNRGGYGVLSVEQILWNSSNVGMAKIVLSGYENNPQKFITGLERIGIFTDLDLEIIGAGRPRMSMPGEAGWSEQSLPRMSYGAEVQMPPIYTLAFYNAIANRGEMIRPIFTREIQRDGKSVERFKTKTLVRTICSDNTLKIIQSMLANTVEKGMGNAAYSHVVPIAGKTGTAQLINRSGVVYGHNVSFCGYFPADKPQYACIIFMHRPEGNPSGGLMCGTVFRTIAEKIYSSQSKIIVRSMTPDSTRISVPEVKNGNTKSLAYVLNRLDVKNEGAAKTEYALAKQNMTAQSIEMKEINIQDNLVPGVIGMGAKDAVFALEKCGLNVRLSGRGKVEFQSAPPGSRITRGQTITITLKN
ncbi:MAG: transpeptidase family protein [Tannerella sp.]|nr:transpeptidase family protein [Tannerella sp.]